MATIEITTLPTEATVDPAADLFIMTDVSETPDALNAVTAGSIQTALAASTTDVLTGTSAAKNVTPDALAALWEKGSDIASAGTISVAEGGVFHITGTTTITDIDFAVDKTGRGAWLIFDGILTLTYNASTLILPTSASITTAAGDAAYVISEGSDAVRVLCYQRRSGASLAGGGGSGDVVGPGSATDNAITRFDSTTGKLVQNSGAFVDDNGYIAPANSSAYNVPCIYGATDTDTGFAIDNNNRILFITGGTETVNFSNNTQRMGSGQVLIWDNNAIASGGTSDIGLARVGSKILGITDASTGGGALSFVEMTAPAAPAANGCYLYTEDSGAGKTRLMAKFSTGAAQQVAIEP